jgi:hypothetical protein
MGHMAAPEPTSVGRRGPELRNMWQRWSSTQKGDEARGHGPHGSTGAHLSREMRSGAVGYVAAPEPNSAGGVVQTYSLCGSTWMHALLLVLT